MRRFSAPMAIPKTPSEDCGRRGGAPANPANPANRLGLILALTGIALTVLVLGQPAAMGAEACTAVDGDTIQCGADRVRIMGLDAPEMQARCPEELRLAVAAAARLRELLAEGVTLQPQGRDRYDRMLAVVLDREGNDLALILIREGLAREYHGRGPRGGWC